MSLTNAEKQELWRERDQMVLTAPVAAIAGQFAAMADQNKLHKIARQLAAMADQNKLHEIARRIDEHLAKTRAASEQRKRQVAATPSEGMVELLHEVLSLRRKVSALERQVAAANLKQPVAGPSEEVAKLRAQNRELKARLRAVAEAKEGTVIMAAEDRREVLRCLHPDLARDSAEQRRLTKAFQIFNALPIHEI
jgi:regulator of replication initiation timing